MADDTIKAPLASGGGWISSISGIIGSVTDWLKFSTAVAMAGVIGLFFVDKSSPTGRWYPLVLIGFLLLIVVGAFFDRHLQRRADLTVNVGGKELSVTTSQQVSPAGKIKAASADVMFTDSRYGFMFTLPTLPKWSKPKYLSSGEALVNAKMFKVLAAWEEAKENAHVFPLGRMVVESTHVVFEYGDPLQIEYTDETSNRGIDATLASLRAKAKEEGVELSSQDEIDFRKQFRIAGTPDAFPLSINLTISVFDKKLAAGSPTEVNVGNMFVLNVKQTGEAVDQIAANQHSMLWGSSQTLTGVKVNGTLRELTMSKMTQLLDAPDRLFQLQISYSPQAESSMAVWDEMREMFKSFRLIA